MKETLEANDKVSVWNTATLYFLVHAVALFALSWRQEKVPKGPFWTLVAGIVVFSGSLYTLSLTNIGVFGATTPIGGVAFLVGWAWLAIKGL